MASYFYMHTIDDRPATFDADDGQIIFADVLPHWQDKPCRVTLRASVKEIQHDQQVTMRNRKSWGMADPAGEYGYVVVHAPTAARRSRPARRRTAKVATHG